MTRGEKRRRELEEQVASIQQEIARLQVQLDELPAAPTDASSHGGFRDDGEAVRQAREALLHELARAKERLAEPLSELEIVRRIASGAEQTRRAKADKERRYREEQVVLASTGWGALFTEAMTRVTGAVFVVGCTFGVGFLPGLLTRLSSNAQLALAISGFVGGAVLFFVLQWSVLRYARRMLEKERARQAQLPFAITGYDQALFFGHEKLRLDVRLSHSPADLQRAADEVRRLDPRLQVEVQEKTLRLTLEMGERTDSNNRTRRAIQRLIAEVLQPLHEQVPIRSVALGD